jgi:hypothetical protein
MNLLPLGLHRDRRATSTNSVARWFLRLSQCYDTSKPLAASRLHRDGHREQPIAEPRKRCFE